MSARYAVIGDPVEHSLSPIMQSAAFRAAGIDATYDAVRVPHDGIETAMQALRSAYAGFNVTTPLKEAVLPSMDSLTSVAFEAQAVNTVRVERNRMMGHNTDGLGFVAALQSLWRIDVQGKSVCLLGSGPAARAIALALGKAGAAPVRCWSRNSSTATKIGAPPAARPDLVVSTLPAQAVLPDDVLETIGGATYVFDVNYRAPRSPVPPNIGSHRSDGLPLLLHQGALAFTFWTMQPAPIDAMQAALTMY